MIRLQVNGAPRQVSDAGRPLPPPLREGGARRQRVERLAIWAERHRFATEIVDQLEGDQAGLKSATVQIDGNDMFIQTRAGLVARVDAETGVTIMQMDEGLDTGDMLAQGFRPIVFCRFIPTAEYVAEELRKRGELEAVGGPPALAERVWEPHLPAIIHQAGLKYTLLDDTHFQSSVLPAQIGAWAEVHPHLAVRRRHEITLRLALAQPLSEVRGFFEKLWGTKLDPKRGLTVVEIMDAVHADIIKGMYILGENPAMSDPDLNHAREALASVQNGIALDPHLAEAHLALGDVYRVQKKDKEAEAAYRKALTLNAELVEAYVGLGALAMTQGRTDEAVLFRAPRREQDRPFRLRGHGGERLRDLKRACGERLHLIPNGVDVETYATAKPFPEFRDGKTNILFVGRCEPRKGAMYLMRAYAQLKQRCPETRLILASAGPQLGELKRFVRDNHLKVVDEKSANCVIRGRVTAYKNSVFGFTNTTSANGARSRMAEARRSHWVVMIGSSPDLPPGWWNARGRARSALRGICSKLQRHAVVCDV